MVRSSSGWQRLSVIVRRSSFAVLAAGLFVVAPPIGDASLASAAVRAGSCLPPAALVGATSRNVDQVVTVDAPSPASTVASVSLWSRAGSCFIRAGGPWSSSIGRGGLSSHKVEGDGSTPIGEYAIGPVMYGIAPNPGVAYRYHRIVCGDWWDEAPSSPMYNRFVHVRCGTAPPFGGDSEALWLVVPQYDYFAVIDYNSSPIVPGRGSAIFIHESVGAPTAGCVALGPSELLTLLRWLRPGAHPVVVIGARASATR